MNEMTPQERATRLAHMILMELVSDKPLYPVGMDELNRQLKAACDEAGVDTKTVLMAVSHRLCDSDAGYERRLRARSAATAHLH